MDAERRDLPDPQAGPTTGGNSDGQSAGGPLSDADETHTAPRPLTATPSSAPSQQWAEFRLLRELGRGAFGRVFSAWDEGLAKEVAVKIIDVPDHKRIQSVLREGQMLARINHRNVVTVHGVRQVGDRIGFIMELIRGESLAELVRRQGRLGPEEATIIGRTLCEALAAVHGADLLHRDIKAQNVMRETGGRIILMDLGAARELQPAGPVNDYTGTPLYFAPELFAGAPASRASDLYSLGVLLYFLVTARFPVEAARSSELARAHSSGARQLLLDRRPDLPRDFCRVVERALLPTPGDRYQSAGEMLEALDNVFRQDRSARTDAAPQVSASIWPWMSRWLLASAIAAVVIVFFGFLTTRGYDATFDLGDFGDDSFSTWAKIGLQAVVPPALYTVMVLVAWLIVRTIWQIALPVVPPLDRLTSRALKTLSSGIERRAPHDLNVTARYLVVTQVLVSVILFLTFQRELIAFVTPVAQSSAAIWQVLDYSDLRFVGVLYYQLCLPIAATAMTLAWRRLLRRPASAHVDRSLVYAGGGIICVLVAAVLVPYRVFYGTGKLPRWDLDGQRCYETGKRGDELKLFCPDVTPGPDRGRIRVVPRSVPALKSTGETGSPFGLSAAGAQSVGTLPPILDPASVAFGYTDRTGSKLLLLAAESGLTIDAARAKTMSSAVCSGGRAFPVRYVQLQKSTAASNGRQSAYNFANDEGQLFEISGGPAEPDDTCLLVPDGYLQAFPVARNDLPKDARDGQSVNRIANAKGRSVKAYRLLHRTGTSQEVAVVEFEPQGDSLLGSLVLVDPTRLSFFDMPASLKEGRARGGCWRVDDDCRFNEEEMDVPAVLGPSGRQLVFFTSRGPEGQLIVLLQAQDGKLVDLRRARRYQSPM